MCSASACLGKIFDDPTHAAGGSTRGSQAAPRRLVVDVREFMSHLPAVLHQQGLELIPVTLEVSGLIDCAILQHHCLVRIHYVCRL